MGHQCNKSRREILKLLAASSGLLVFPIGPLLASEGRQPGKGGKGPYWAYAIDTARCIGCCACMRGCRDENDVPEGVFRTWVERYRVRMDGDVGVDVATSIDHVFEPIEGEVANAFFVPKLCNHCEKSVCNQVCPVGAAFNTPDGVVLVDQEHCIGCGYCVQACPYGSRYINPVTHTADKCTLCYHRITKGRKTACVEICPVGARQLGDRHDPYDPVNEILATRRVQVLQPELLTRPQCYYLGLDMEVR